MGLPQHVAVIMDGNGRWAKRRLLPRIAGHREGVESVRAIVTECLNKGIPYLTLFAFSSENWKRPRKEVDFLINLLLEMIRKEVRELLKKGVRLTVVGDRSAFSSELNTAIEEAEALTEHNTGLRLTIAFNYGGRWDMVQATQRIAEKVTEGLFAKEQISEALLSEHLALSDCPDPDLLIRTSGEFRLSNFLLWQLAYAELYFTKTYWPDFREGDFQQALEAYALRNRRFGQTPEPEGPRVMHA